MKYNTHTLLVFMAMLFCSHNIAQSQTDILTADVLPPKDASYMYFTGVKLNSGSVYAGNTARESPSVIKIRKGDGSGIVTTSSEKVATGLQLKWSNSATGKRYIYVYGKSSAYSSTNDLYTSRKGDLLFKITRGDNTVHPIDGHVKYIGIAAEGGVSFLESINIEWKNQQILNFDQKSYDVVLGMPFSTPTLTGAQTTVTYSSSNEDVASVDSQTGDVVIHNTGTTTITATAMKTDVFVEATASYVLNVNPEETNVSFDFSKPENFGLLWEGSNVDLAFSPIVGDAVVYFKGSEKSPYFNQIPNGIRLCLGDNRNITIRVPNGLNFANATLTGIGLKGKKTIDKNQVLFDFDVSNLNITSLELTYYGDYKLSVTEAGYATFCANRSYIMPEGLQGGIGIIDGSTINVKYVYQAGDVVPAGEALLIKGKAGIYDLHIISEHVAVPVQENVFAPAFSDDRIHELNNKYYVLAYGDVQNKQLGFYYQKGCADGSYVENISNKAYIKLPSINSVNGGLCIDDQNITGIKAPKEVGSDEVIIHTLSGVPLHTSVKQLRKGFYIVNGKKIIIK